MVLLKEEVVRQNTSRDGILYCHDAILRTVAFDNLAQLVECEALDRIDRTAEMREGSHLVKAGGNPLDSYFHSVFPCGLFSALLHINCLCFAFHNWS